MSEAELPVHSTKTLVKAMSVASLIAGVVFVAVVLPAEYDIDPTGVGEMLGLNVLAQTSGESISTVRGAALSAGERSDTTTITVPAKSGLEYKFQLTQYGKLQYEWDAGDSELYFDLHGEPDGGEPGYFESYGEATASEMKGALTVPFTGSHGWYWRNRSEEQAVITLTTSGSYEVIGLK